MKRFSLWQRGTLVFLTLAVPLATMAPAAEAYSSRYRSRPGVRYVARDYGRPYYVHRSSGAGPAIAGFIGGLVVGSVISRSSSQPRYHDSYGGGYGNNCPPQRGSYGGGYGDNCPPQRGSYGAGYAYDDPYCHERFSSLDSYYAHMRSDPRCHRHPMVARVIEIRTGEPVGYCTWDQGRWVNDDRASDRDRGYDNRGYDDRDRGYDDQDDNGGWQDDGG